MKVWLALLVTPSLALAAQSLMFALVSPSCANQARGWIHAVAVASLAVALVLTWVAWGEWKRYGAPAGHPPDSDAPDPASARRFLAIAATGVAGLSALVILAMWIGVWVLWPCGQLH